VCARATLPFSFLRPLRAAERAERDFLLRVKRRPNTMRIHLPASTPARSACSLLRPCRWALRVTVTAASRARRTDKGPAVRGGAVGRWVF
jgi:hypothetical protein